MHPIRRYRKFGALTSSVDPTKFSLTWEASIKFAITLIGAYAAIKGIDATTLTEQVQEFSQSITVIGSSLYAIYNAGQIAYGLARKIAARLSNPVPESAEKESAGGVGSVGPR